MTANQERIRRIAAYFKPHIPAIAISVLCTAAIGAVAGATAWMVKPVLDDIFIKNDVTMLGLVPVALVILYLVKGLCTFGQGYMMNKVAQHVIMSVRNDLMIHVQSRELDYFDRTPTGGIVNRILADVAIMQNTIPTMILQARQYISAVGLLIVLFTRDFVLASIAMLILPLIALPISKITKKVKRYTRKSQLGSDVLSRLLIESFQGIEVVKSFNWQKVAASRFLAQNNILLKLSLKRGAVTNITSPAVEFFGSIGAACIIWYGGREVLLGHTTPGNFFSFMAAFFMLYDPLKRIGTTSNQLQQAFVSAERVFEMFDESPDPIESDGEKLLTGDIEEIEFREVEFTYKSRPDRKVLDKVSFKARKGEIVALVGESGGGKSTILKLLPRLYGPEGGGIYINGVNVREYEIHSLREKIAIVNQSPFLFDESISFNIRMGRPEASDNEVEAAAKAAYAHDFIAGLPNGYETGVGERGDLLSGGQKQRIAIARAILRDAPVLILDEATSSLDSESEKEIQLALLELMKGRTTLVIAHRLSTIMHADQILFIKDGRVTEAGTHGELLAANGGYARLCRIQFGED